MARPFLHRDEDGLTAVIATAFLIGVAILLAIAVFAMVNLAIGHQPEAAPVVGFTELEDNDQWRVTQAPDELPWAAFQMKATGFDGVIKVRLSDDAGSEGLELDGSLNSLPASDFTGFIEGGQYLDFCSSVVDSAVKITLVHDRAEAIAHQHTFRQLEADPSCV